VDSGGQRRWWNGKFSRQDYFGEPNAFAQKALSYMREYGFERILDLGCGDGRDSVFFALEGLNVHAVDFAREGVKILKREAEEAGVNVRSRVIDYSGGLTGFKDESFQTVYSHLSLHYFDDHTTSHIIEEIQRILCHGGLFFIKVKSTHDKLYGKGKKTGENTYILDGHLRHFYTKKYLREKLVRFNTLELEEKTQIIHQKKGRYPTTTLQAITQKT